MVLRSNEATQGISFKDCCRQPDMWVGVAVLVGAIYFFCKTNTFGASPGIILSVGSLFLFGMAIEHAKLSASNKKKSEPDDDIPMQPFHESETRVQEEV